MVYRISLSSTVSVLFGRECNCKSHEIDVTRATSSLLHARPRTMEYYPKRKQNDDVSPFDSRYDMAGQYTIT